MSIVFAGIAPHPPILIPEIGGSDSKKVEKTANALLDLGQKLNATEPDTIIIISPHGLLYPDRMNVCGMEKLFGNFGQFDHPEISFLFKNDLELAEKIDKAANKDEIETLLYHNGKNEYELDHGTLVPLYFLTKNLDNPVKILPIAYSFQDRAKHYSFGQTIAEVCKNTYERIAIIASGDLSHRLFPQSFMDNTKAGIEFDKKLLRLIETNDIQEILNLDEEFVERAGECAYHSILILLGVIEKLNYQSKVLSYEGPFGVGYMVVNFGIKDFDAFKHSSFDSSG